MPLTAAQRHRNEASIRAAMDRLLSGDLPPNGACDLKTLASEAGVARTGFYSRTGPSGNQRPGPYQHLGEEFQRRLAALREAGTIPDPREFQIARLKKENDALRERVATRDEQIAELTEFKQRALSQLAAKRSSVSARPPSRPTTCVSFPPPPTQGLPDHADERRPPETDYRDTTTCEHRPQGTSSNVDTNGADGLRRQAPTRHARNGTRPLPRQSTAAQSRCGRDHASVRLTQLLATRLRHQARRPQPVRGGAVQFGLDVLE